MKRRGLTLSLSTALLWMVVVAFLYATLGLSDSWSESLIVGGSCAAAIGLLQQMLWLSRLPELHDHRKVRRLAILWRFFVVVAMFWSFVVLAASYEKNLPSYFKEYDSIVGPGFGTKALATANLAAGILTAMMTAPWLRSNRLSKTSVSVRSICLAFIAGVPLVLYLAFDRGLMTALLDISTQGFVAGMSERVTVSSGALPMDITRGNALTHLFVFRSVIAWCGVVISLIVVSIVGRVQTRARVRYCGYLVAILLAIPAFRFLHWMVVGGYRENAPLLWLTHPYPPWQILSLALLPLLTVTVMLSIKREGVDLRLANSQPRFLCDSNVTYCLLLSISLMKVWETVSSEFNEGLWALLESMGSSEGYTLFMLKFAVSDLFSSSGGMLLTGISAISAGAIVSRWRFAEVTHRSLTLVHPWQIVHFTIVLLLVALVIFCTIPFGASLIHVGI